MHSLDSVCDCVAASTASSSLVSRTRSGLCFIGTILYLSVCVVVSTSKNRLLLQIVQAAVAVVVVAAACGVVVGLCASSVVFGVEALD